MLNAAIEMTDWFCLCGSFRRPVGTGVVACFCSADLGHRSRANVALSLGLVVWAELDVSLTTEPFSGPRPGTPNDYAAREKNARY